MIQVLKVNQERKTAEEQKAGNCRAKWENLELSIFAAVLQEQYGGRE